MSILAERLPLHLITPPSWTSWERVERSVSDAIEAGVEIVQFRDKSSPAREMADRAARLARICRDRGALMLVNDRLDVALAVEAHGVHLGAADLPWARARELAPDGFFLGCTAATPGAVACAAQAGADYVGAGPAHVTSTKTDTGPQLSVNDYRTLARSCTRNGGLPLIAIGGIGREPIAPLIAAGASGIAICGGIFADDDPGARARALVDELRAALVTPQP